MTNDTSREAIAACKGKLITDATLRNNELVLTFDDDTRLCIVDDGQQCCESRWMSTDDHLADIIGTTLLDVVQTDGQGTVAVPPGDDDDIVHDVVFVRVTTTGGPVVLVNHSEHNGYYGGFVLAATLGRRH